MTQEIKIAVVIPAFKVKRQLQNVVDLIPPYIWRIYIVDDACPEGSTINIKKLHDNRIIILKHEFNLGVGGAMKTGYLSAINDGADILVKIDGDGQMNPKLIMDFASPIIDGEADYTKGNRFYDLEAVKQMPRIRIFGNAILSMMCKLSSGYWDIFDPTNGYTAIDASVCKNLPFSKISNRYFFETDMLFRLNLSRAVVMDIPMESKYGAEISNLRISKIIFEFLIKHIRNFSKRVFYNYFLRDMSLASIELFVGVFLMMFGIIFGLNEWTSSYENGVASPAGTVMLAAMPVLIGLQLILAFLGYDISSVPRKCIHKSYKKNG